MMVTTGRRGRHTLAAFRPTRRRYANPGLPGHACEHPQRPRRGEEGSRQGCTCELPDERQDRGRSLRHVEDAAGWCVRPHGRRSHRKLSFRWHIGPADTIVHLSPHNVIASGVRAAKQNEGAPEWEQETGWIGAPEATAGVAATGNLRPRPPPPRRLRWSLCPRLRPKQSSTRGRRTESKGQDRLQRQRR